MKLSGWRWPAVSSLLVAALVAGAETRPQYGGTLRVWTRQTLLSFTPVQDAAAESNAQANLTHLVFESLVTIDERGVAQPALAISWQASRDQRRWTFRLRPGVRFHDGAALTGEAAVASLRAANPAWRVAADKDSITIDSPSPIPAMIAELALPRNAICAPGQGSMPVGTGPFRVAEWDSGKHFSLTANDDYWAGRPYLDSVEVEMGKSFRDQLTAFQSGKADFIEIAPERAQQPPIDRQDIRSSLPMELVALVFTRDPQSPNEKLLRQALAFSIDRNAIGSVLLQGAGQPAGSLLPNWMTGYAFVFSTDTDQQQARRIRSQVSSGATWTLDYDGNDPLSRLIAERIALNARDVGLTVKPLNTTSPDLRLVRIPLESADPGEALERLTALTGLPTLAMQNDSIEEVFAVEQSLLATERIIPLFHLPLVYAISPAVRNSILDKGRNWNLSNAWLGNKP